MANKSPSRGKTEKTPLAPIALSQLGGAVASIGLSLGFASGRDAEHVPLVRRLLCVGAGVGLNTVMLRYYIKANQESQSAAQVAGISMACNFLFAHILDVLVIRVFVKNEKFELLSREFYLGVCFLLLGVQLLAHLPAGVPTPAEEQLHSPPREQNSFGNSPSQITMSPVVGEDTEKARLLGQQPKSPTLKED